MHWRSEHALCSTKVACQVYPAGQPWQYHSNLNITDWIFEKSDTRMPLRIWPIFQIKFLYRLPWWFGTSFCSTSQVRGVYASSAGWWCRCLGVGVQPSPCLRADLQQCHWHALAGAFPGTPASPGLAGFHGSYGTWRAIQCTSEGLLYGTNCDPHCETGCGHCFMLGFWTSATLLYVWHIHIYTPQTQNMHQHAC